MADSPETLLSLFARRRETVEFLESLPPDDLAKRGRHPQFGEMTVDLILGAISYHEREHVEQIRGLRQKLGLDGGTSP